METKDLFTESYRITKEMVAIPSVNGTSGEKDIGLYIESYLRDIPYFKDHPEEVVVQLLKGDKLKRRNVFAILEGRRSKSCRTIILHGHTDTVGVEDYGILKKHCFDSDSLLDALKEVPLSDEVRKDLESGLYMFGRGSVDMKSGDAVLMAIANLMSERLDELEGNLIFAFNPVEENMHTGMIESLDFYQKIKKERGYEYIFAINNDYTCPLYAGDEHNYIYTGAVGKLLPSFYILGKSTHVGQCLEGFDASLIASRLVEKIDLNTDFCDGYEGEYSLPPAVLKISDLKDFYNVQTAQEAFVYFNYFVHDASILEVTSKLVTAAHEALADVQNRIKECSESYYDKAQMEYIPFEYEPNVYEYKQIYEIAKDTFDGNLEAHIRSFISGLDDKKYDIREKMMLLVKELSQIAKITAPAIVFFYTPPYCPHSTLHEEVDREKELIDSLGKILKDVEKEENVEYKMLHFYPSLSDSSYIKIDDPKDSVEALHKDFPDMDYLYPIPFDKIGGLDIPAFTFGTYGKDAHKWTERVHKPYTFGVLPKLIEKTIRYYLEA
ncbi:Arginine utilization protein RocB [Butyrivibrio fibrisolvens DSM 3071]|uniref:Arginine utilization protein RocB n=1 Tax=Butyrivibrio fibrisolvens DSM 3071 TaxID=1121131 RepID=A0A1M6DP82_BUTFI|nr:M20/M25/M40 family metallo-hydrolase [Butyrivibrio fibrisolvens]SHI75064.1 Arginine utilization protein RocB [Butyrivibrio fibrisolvens DSM 3071]